MAGPLRRTGQVLAQAALTATAVLGLLAVLVAALAAVGHVRPLVIESGSMEPTIATGALALSHPVPAGDLRVGDVVCVPSHGVGVAGARVTHRIEHVTVRAGTATLVLRGDANPVPDAEVYQVVSADRVFFDVPYAGWVISWLSAPPGVFVLAGFVALMLAIALGRRGPGSKARPAPQPRVRATSPRSPGVRRPAALTLLVTVTLGVGQIRSAGPTWGAPWRDSVSVSGTSVSTLTPGAPVASCGTVSPNSVTVTWTGVPQATGYRVSYPSPQTSVDVAASQLSFVLSDNNTSGTFTVRTLVSGWVSGSSNPLTYVVKGKNSCT